MTKAATDSSYTSEIRLDSTQERKKNSLDHARNARFSARLKRFVPYVALFVIFFIMGNTMELLNDDYVFKAGIERYGSIFGWVEFFSQNWGGRVIPQGLLVLLLQLPSVVFNTINAAMWTLLFAYAEKCFNFASPKLRYIVFALLPIAVFVLIPTEVLSGSVFWKCANVLYLWGTAATLIALYPSICSLRNKTYSKHDLLFAALGCLYASSFEQVAVFMAVAMVMFVSTQLICSRKIDIALVAITVEAIVFTVFFCTMPGNSVRSSAEVLRWFQSYDMYSTVDKILLGLNYSIGGIETNGSIFLLGLSSLTTYLLYTSRKTSMILFYGSCITTGYFLLCFVDAVALANTGHAIIGAGLFKLFDVTVPEFGFGKLQLLKVMLNFGLVVFLGAALSTIPGDRTGVIVMALFFGGIATMVIMGFSPTMFASGERPRFVGYFLMLCSFVLSATAAYARTKPDAKNELPKSSL